MSRWTHPQCEACWINAESTLADDGIMLAVRRPTVLRDPPAEHCCFCGQLTIVGIYRRGDPAKIGCDHE